MTLNFGCKYLFIYAYVLLPTKFQVSLWIGITQKSLTSVFCCKYLTENCSTCKEGGFRSMGFESHVLSY